MIQKKANPSRLYVHVFRIDRSNQEIGSTMVEDFSRISQQTPDCVSKADDDDEDHTLRAV